MKRLAPPFVWVPVLGTVLGCSQAKEAAPPPSASLSASLSAAPSGSAAAPRPSASIARKHGLPTWDEVDSGHKGTNPPHPVLITDAAGYCYKKYEGGMTQPGPNRLEGICDREHPCGTQIECPKGASALSRGGKAELTEQDAVALAEAHLEKAGGKPSTKPASRLITSSKLWIITWSPQAEVMVDAISGRIVK